MNNIEAFATRIATKFIKNFLDFFQEFVQDNETKVRILKKMAKLNLTVKDFNKIYNSYFLQMDTLLTILCTNFSNIIENETISFFSKFHIETILKGKEINDTDATYQYIMNEFQNLKDSWSGKFIEKALSAIKETKFQLETEVTTFDLEYILL